MTVPSPPDPFDAEAEVLVVGARLYRVATTSRPATAFNPGYGTRTRFAFFGTPPVPVLYAAESPTAALAESLLHDVPPSGGFLTADVYSRAVMVRLEVTAPLRLAKLRGDRVAASGRGGPAGD